MENQDLNMENIENEIEESETVETIENVEEARKVYLDNKYLTVDEGIENRIIKNINKSNSWEELVTNTKTKRYTYNKINRMLLHILLGITKEDNNQDIYLRILGFNKQGQTYLNKIKKNIDIPIYIGYKKNLSHTFDIEFKSTYIYSLITNDSKLIENEYKNKPIIK